MEKLLKDFFELSPIFCYNKVNVRSYELDGHMCKAEIAYGDESGRQNRTITVNIWEVLAFVNSQILK